MPQSPLSHHAVATPPHQIKPYKYASMWVFDDEKYGLDKEPFVSGADDIIDLMVKNIPDAEDGFVLCFSETPFPEYQIMLEWRRGDNEGNWYYQAELDKEGWLCPALFNYFDKAPEKLFVQCKKNIVHRKLTIRVLAPEDEMIEMPVRSLGNNRFQSLAETDFLFGTLLLWGDNFLVEPANAVEYRLKEIEQPSHISHFMLCIGNYVMSAEIKTSEARDSAITDLNNLFDSLYSTPLLRKFLKACGGHCDYWDFPLLQLFFIHIPTRYKSVLLEQLPILCPDIDAGELKEIFSGDNTYWDE